MEQKMNKESEYFKHPDMRVTRILFHIADIPSNHNFQRCKRCSEIISSPPSTAQWEPGTAIMTGYNISGKVIIRVKQDNLTAEAWAKARPCSDMYIN